VARVVQQNPQRVERVLKQKRHGREQNEWHQFFRMILPNDIIDDSFRDRGENNHHQRADDRAAQHSRCEPRITLHISKNAPHGFHG